MSPVLLAWIRKLEEVTKRYRIAAAAHNLGRIMRLLFGIGKPRVLQGPTDLAWLAQLIVLTLWSALAALVRELRAIGRVGFASAAARGRRAARSLN